MEPIPVASGFANLANLLPRPQWDRLRRAVYRRAGHRCQACGRRTVLHCHEVWRFNPRTQYQHLGGFRALCPTCHAATHITQARGRRQRALLRHYVATNGLQPNAGPAALKDATRRQQWLDRFSWTVIYGDYNLRTPAARTPSVRRCYARRR
jgi:hypothetical protein